jgi:ligand-binding sensor domain-containing protein
MNISNGYAQLPIRFKRYSTENGLSQGTIYSMFQDSRGFMWFGTWDGLNRFDGYDFTRFKPKAGDTNSIAGNYINSILEDKKGNLWVGTNEALNKYDYKNKNFKNIISAGRV